MSLVEVANLAGVSTATVSKVINNYPSVSREMTDRVRDAMRQLDWAPSARKRQQKAEDLPVAVLVLHANAFHPYTSTFSFMVEGVESALRNRGVDMLLAHVGSIDEIPRAVSARQVRGLVLVGHNPDEAVVRSLEDFPAVWLTSHHAATGDVLLAGNEAVGRLAAEYLLGRGHRRLGVLSALRNSVLEVRCQFFEFVAGGRGATVKRYLGRATEELAQRRVLDLAAFEAEVEPQVDALLAASDRPTGLFVPFDMQVAMVYRILAKRGVQPGKDLDIIGSDDEKASLLGLYPRPATINIGPSTMGRRAVEQLFSRMENESKDDRRVRVMVEPELVPGD